MPIYEYLCKQCGEEFEIYWRSSAEIFEPECENCLRPVERKVSRVATKFSGSGFHNTDYGKTGPI